jgi:hypothetical protein
MVAILKKQLGITKTLNEILQICSVNIFEQAPATEILAAQTDENVSACGQFVFQKSFEFNDL